jgi:hypothetical protein
MGAARSGQVNRRKLPLAREPEWQRPRRTAQTANSFNGAALRECGEVATLARAWRASSVASTGPRSEERGERPNAWDSYRP